MDFHKEIGDFSILYEKELRKEIRGSRRPILAKYFLEKSEEEISIVVQIELQALKQSL